MLRELAVQNLAVIEDVRVELRPGFCVWTGETGAGKSLLLGALGLLLGGRGGSELIRSGAEELRVVGRFEFANAVQRAAVAEAVGCEPGDELVVSRRLHRGGKSTAYIDDVPAAIGTLRRLGELLVDIHGQRDSHSLLEPAYQLELLDAFGKLGPQKAAVSKAAARLRELRRRRAELAAVRSARLRELNLVRFEMEELDQVRVEVGELARLNKERERLLHAQALTAFSAAVAAKLYDDEGSVVETLGRLAKDSHHWAGFDPRLADLSRRLDVLRLEVHDLADTGRDLVEAFEADPKRLDAIEHRLQTLRKLESKYARPADELPAYRAALGAAEASLQSGESELATVERDLIPAVAVWREAAQKLSEARRRVATALAAETADHLADLQMPAAKLEAVLEPLPLGDDPFVGEVPESGADRFELLLAANPGEPARPLRKVASGGELSRTMLALKTVLAAHDPVRTLVVFDEIDANVGGRLGDVLGRKLAALGQSHQVLCVTHLPQVAGYAGHHWTIRKNAGGNRTATRVVPLATDAARVEELALMLRGANRTASTAAEAAAMLAAGRAAISRRTRRRGSSVGRP
jgi:DNA repair protein RecN (Recombination protein N)